MMAELNNIVVHCSDSTWGTAAEIRQWHLSRGWRDIGYHYVITNGLVKPGYYVDSMDGSVEAGRTLDGDGFITGGERGAHALGYNDNSIGICLIGVGYFTPKQFGALLGMLNELRTHFQIPITNIVGHYETEQSHWKTCPNIYMEKVRYLLGKVHNRDTRP
jgi:hypothetical protein